MEMRFTGDENAPKVRKPYTITKQRERWTQDEHNKFLEALKLYGRAWRRIEAHVGTKTAVQIRSHAQKFFSKVVRESTTTTTDGMESIKPVDIPPPRPKRKPSHPYPRKPANSTAEQSSFKKSQVSASSSSPRESTYVEENGSPTSVLSAMDDEVMELSGSISPDSCTTTPYQNLSDSESKDDNIFAERQNSSSPVQSGSVVLNPDVSEDDSSVMDFWRAEGNVETPTTCLKLFGKTVKIVDANNTASSASNNTENCHSASKSNIEPSCVGDWSGVSAEVKENADTKQDSGVSSTDWLPPAFCYWPYSQTHTDPSLNIIPPFMFPFYLPFPFVHNLGSNSMQPAPPADNGESQTDGSSCSISQSAGIETEWPKCRGDEKNTSLDKPVKGFVPYKR